MIHFLKSESCELRKHDMGALYSFVGSIRERPNLPERPTDVQPGRKPPTVSAMRAVRSLRWVGPALLAFGVAIGGACGSSDDRLVVSAASSLTDVFAAIETEFEASHPNVDVVLNLASTATLAEQISQGAPADVLAAADEATAQRLGVEGLLTGAPVAFASNTMVIAVPSDNPRAVRSLADFAREELLIGLCVESVPCGALASQIFESAGISASVDTFEPNVRSLVGKIELGELDAAITYITDVLGRDTVEAVEIPTEMNATTRYPIVVLRDAKNDELAREFVALVLSERGQAILAEHGFSSP